MTSSESISPESSQGRTVSDDPLCTETILPHLDAWITPTDHFYIRSHFSDLPDIDSSTYRLLVEGAVHSPLTLSYDELLALPGRETTATLECAGNSRAYVTPPAEGLHFLHGAVGNATWRGVPVSELLARAGLLETAKEVLFEGADVGEEEEEGESLRLSYERSLPIDKAMDRNTIVAYLMNGEPLERAHGYPLRLIVPGWYGMASVKWLRRIQVLEDPFHGFFQNRRYILIDEGVADRLAGKPVTTVRVKSLITRPRHGEVVKSSAYTILGVAWSGEGEITEVEVSTDGGRSWRKAALVGPSLPHAWRQWEYPWKSSNPGHFILTVRATDSSGNTQPARIAWNFRGYANNSVHTIAVEVPKGHSAP